MFSELINRELVENDFEEILNKQFLSTEKNYAIDNYIQFLNKYFYLYEELNSNEYDNWLPLAFEEKECKGNKK